MKENNSQNSPSTKFGSSICLVPEELLDSLVAKQDRILELLEVRKDATINGFISEKQAIEKVNKRNTWFWQMRKTGQLPFKKIGKTIYYAQTDINSLLEKKQ